jgi:hypothetical protein
VAANYSYAYAPVNNWTYAPTYNTAPRPVAENFEMLRTMWGR